MGLTCWSREIKLFGIVREEGNIGTVGDALGVLGQPVGNTHKVIQGVASFKTATARLDPR